jgi:type III restriction enzyme
MTVEIKFAANQQYQRDAINSVVELFAGQDAVDQSLVPLGLGGVQDTLEGFQEVVFGNTLSLDPTTIETNLRRVQDRPVAQDEGEPVAVIPDAYRREFTGEPNHLDFSVEMETGTGKTYVYLRTIAELRLKYGFTKFVIVVPSVAIREGVLSNLRLLKEHIRDQYDGLQYDAYVYDSSHLTRVRQFATSSHLQIMVINIDSFTKETNVINRPTDAMNGYAPIEFLRACQPVVVMDEPQNMETPIRQEAIRSLAPIFKLRYSATHRDLKHLVYRLTPVDAYDLRLVKRIGVLSITKDDDLNDAYVEVTKINATPGSVTATVKIYKATKQGTKATQIMLRKDDDLFELSGGRDVYMGWAVEDIHATHDGALGYVEFGNGHRAWEGASGGSAGDQHQRLMIRQAVESHFEKELQLKLQERRKTISAPLKPLTLFFIDRVANYHPADGKFRSWFEQEYASVKAHAKFRALAMPDVSVVHDGYFATSARGVPKDTTFGRDTKDTEGAFERIMQNKEKLLGFEEPLRFIFSHSALVEGWDNPNVFTICNMQDGRTEMRKRQQVGRGLRLPVMANGERCHVDDINLLTVIAHEDFSKFAGDLQKEIEDETGVSFDGRISNLKTDKIRLQLKEAVLSDPIFKKLWDRISRKTTYELRFQSDDVVAEAVERIHAMEPLESVKFRVAKVAVDMKAEGVVAGDARDRGTVEVEGAQRLPDVVGELTRRVALSRATIVRILKAIDNLDQVKVNPAVFIDRVGDAINQALYDQAAQGIVYSPSGDDRWTAELFKSAHQDETVAKTEFVVPVQKSVTDKIVCDSGVEVQWATYFEAQDNIPLFLKLPGWFLVPTPLGNYNPDWAFVRKEEAGHYLYLVRESKGTDKLEALQWEAEGWKIKFGKAHFNALNVDYDFHWDPAVAVEIDARRERL